MKIAIVYHSGYGHTEALVSHLESGVKSEGVEVKSFKVNELSEDLKELDGFEGMIFGAPTYMGDVSSDFKKFMEKSVKVWFVRGWKDRVAGGFTNSGSPDGDKTHSLGTIMNYAIGQGMVWVGQAELPSTYGAHKDTTPFSPQVINRSGVYIGTVAQSNNAPVDANNPSVGDRQTAEMYGKRVASFVKRMNK